MAYITDIGLNLMNSAFDPDRDAVLERAENAGVKTFIITGSSIQSSTDAVNYINLSTKKSINFRSTAGVHPHNPKHWDNAALNSLKELVICNSNIIAALGECGLDYNRNFSPKEAQLKCFKDQLALATQLGKPVFLHERDAFEDFYSVLSQYRQDIPGAVVHCFTGTEFELDAYIKLGCHIGITGWICDERRGSHLIPLLSKIPSDLLLLETDAPYLLPRNLPKNHRGKSSRNEPAFLSHIANFTAQILGKTPEQIAKETSANAAKLF